MPIQIPFSPSRLRRRLSRETADSGRSSPERPAANKHHSRCLGSDRSPGREDRAGRTSSRGRRNGRDRGRDGRHTRPSPSSRGNSPPKHADVTAARTGNEGGGRQKSPSRDRGRIQPGAPQAGWSPGSPALPYSKDFGSFDLTLCEADDGRCVVLVEYEDRVFLNGKQIYISLSGTVMDKDGQPNELLQKNYDCVLQEKRRIRKPTQNRTPVTRKETCNVNNSEKTLLHDNRAIPRSIFKDTVTSPRLPQLCARKKNMGSHDERSQIFTDLADIEASFSKIVARLCQAILRYGREQSTETASRPADDAGFSDAEISKQVHATLDRLIDQFQSVVELSATMDDADENIDVNEAVDDEEMIEKWVSEAFGENKNKKREDADKRIVEDPERGKERLKGPTSSTRNVGTQMRERRVEKRDRGEQTVPMTQSVETSDKQEQTDKRIVVDEQYVRELREENRLLQGELFEVETEVRELREQQGEMETRLEEEIAAKVAIAKQLADAEGCMRKLSPRDDVNQFRDVTQQTDSITEQNVVTTVAVAARTVSSVSLSSQSSTTSSDSCQQQPVDAREAAGCMRQKSRALKSEIGRLRDVYADVEDQLSKLVEDNTQLKLRSGKMERDVKEMMKQLDLANQSRDEYKAEIKNVDKLNAELEKRVNELSKEKSFTSDKLCVANDELSKVDVERRKAKRDLHELEKRFENLKGDKERLCEEFCKLEKAHLEDSAKSARLSKSSAENELQLTVLRGQLGDITVELNQLRAENHTNVSARCRYEHDNRKLETDLRAARKMNGELSAELLQLKSRIGALEDTVRHLEADNAELTQKTVHLSAAREALSKRALDAETSNESLSAAMKSTESEAFRLKRENLELRTTVEQMNMINTSIRSRLDNWGKDNVDITKRMKQLVGVKGELQGFIQQLNSVNFNIEKRFEKMDCEYADLERRLQTAGQGEDHGEGVDVCPQGATGSPVLQELD